MTDSYTVAQWETHPYTSHDKRGQTVYHRVRLLCYFNKDVDVVVERKEPAAGVDEWTEVEVYECRDHAVSYVDKRGGL